MSVIVKGMDLPLGCCYEEYEKWYGHTEYCPFCNHDDVPYCILELNHMVFEELHFIEIDSRPDWCPLIEIPKDARLIDGKELKENIIKWMPPDPCGVEEKEFPFETDICVSTLMEIDEAPTIFEDNDES